MSKYDAGIVSRVNCSLTRNAKVTCVVGQAVGEDRWRTYSMLGDSFL